MSVCCCMSGFNVYDIVSTVSESYRSYKNRIYHTPHRMFSQIIAFALFGGVASSKDAAVKTDVLILVRDLCGCNHDFCLPLRCLQLSAE